MSNLKAALVLLGFVLVCGCSAPEPGTGPTDTAAADSTYAEAASIQVLTSRGEVVGLPNPGDPLHLVKIHHEALDTLKGRDGTVVGMDAMTMPMALDDDVSLEGFAAGDKVEFTLEVDWTAKPGMKVTEIRHLPTETELVFRKARPE